MTGTIAGGEGIGLAVFFIVGLLGGAHCLGMCGPLVTTYADRMAGRKNALSWLEIRQHALFNAGRTLSYATIGALLGLGGGLVFDAAALVAFGETLRSIVGVFAGLLIVGVGTSYVVSGSTALSRLEVGGVFTRVTNKIAPRVDRWVRGPRIMGLGALHGVLPCPILYPAFLYALARGSPVEGAASLAALGIGTFPTLFLYGTAFGTLGPTTRHRLHRALGVAFLALGYIPLSMGLRTFGVPLPTAPVPFYQPLS